MANIHGLALKEKIRKQRYTRACNDLFWLSTEIIGTPPYTMMTREFHKPMLDEWDRRNKLRSLGKYSKDELDIWSREYLKTTALRARCIQAYLRRPDLSIIWWHAVEDKAEESAQAIGHIMQTCKELRRLAPPGSNMFPSTRQKKWVKANGFRLPSNPSMSKPTSMRAYGAGSEATGGHGDLGVLDDIIGYNTIADSLMPKKRRFLRQTVANVIGNGFLWAIGTNWDSDDVYVDPMQKSKDWDVRIRGALEIDGKPDWNGTPVFWTKEQIAKKRRTMTRFEFSCQMMNDPLPEGARLWPRGCEEDLFIAKKDAARGRGIYVVLSDPAPANVGSLGDGSRKRGDGSKDYWSICVVKLRVNGQKLERILLYGEHSQDWRTTEGLTRAARMMKQFGTNKFFEEYIGGASSDNTEDMVKVCQQEGVPLYREKDGRLPSLKSNRGAGAKNLQFERLCDAVRSGEFLICEETVPEEFLRGDGDYTGFLTQSRKWAVTPDGKRNTLRFDDDANVVSFCMDDELARLAPSVEWSPWGSEEDDDALEAYPYRSRRCAV